MKVEQEAIAQIEQAVADNPDDIAAVPIYSILSNFPSSLSSLFKEKEVITTLEKSSCMNFEDWPISTISFSFLMKYKLVLELQVVVMETNSNYIQENGGHSNTLM